MHSTAWFLIPSNSPWTLNISTFFRSPRSYTETEGFLQTSLHDRGHQMCQNSFPGPGSDYPVKGCIWVWFWKYDSRYLDYKNTKGWTPPELVNKWWQALRRGDKTPGQATLQSGELLCKSHGQWSLIISYILCWNTLHLDLVFHSVAIWDGMKPGQRRNCS